MNLEIKKKKISYLKALLIVNILKAMKTNIVLEIIMIQVESKQILCQILIIQAMPFTPKDGLAIVGNSTKPELIINKKNEATKIFR